MFKAESYTKIGEHDYIFHYSFSDLRAFVIEGIEFTIDIGKNSKDETITAFIFDGIPIIGVK